MIGIFGSLVMAGGVWWVVNEGVLLWVVVWGVGFCVITCVCVCVSLIVVCHCGLFGCGWRV